MTPAAKAAALAVALLGGAPPAAAAPPSLPEVEPVYRDMAIRCLAIAYHGTEKGWRDAPLPADPCTGGRPYAIDVPGHGPALVVLRAGNQVAIMTLDGAMHWYPFDKVPAERRP